MIPLGFGDHKTGGQISSLIIMIGIGLALIQRGICNYWVLLPNPITARWA